MQFPLGGMYCTSMGRILGMSLIIVIGEMEQRIMEV